jgi:hypothetical protein
MPRVAGEYERVGGTLLDLFRIDNRRYVKYAGGLHEEGALHGLGVRPGPFSHAELLIG